LSTRANTNQISIRTQKIIPRGMTLPHQPTNQGDLGRVPDDPVERRVDLANTVVLRDHLLRAGADDGLAIGVELRPGELPGIPLTADDEGLLDHPVLHVSGLPVGLSRLRVRLP